MFLKLPTLGPVGGIPTLNPFHSLNYKKIVSLVQLEGYSGGLRWLDLCNAVNVSNVNNPPWIVTPRGDYAISGNGSNQYATTGSNGIPASIGDASQANITIACWIRSTTVAAGRGMFGLGSSANDAPVFFLSSGASTNFANVRAFWRNTANTPSGGISVTGTKVYQDGSWHRLLATKTTAGVVSLYVDGIPDGTISGATGSQALDRLYIGALHRNSLGSWIAAQISHCDLWERALTPDEVLQDYIVTSSGSRELLSPLTDDLSLLIQSNAGYKSWWGGRSGVYGGGMI